MCNMLSKSMLVYLVILGTYTANVASAKAAKYSASVTKFSLIDTTTNEPVAGYENLNSGAVLNLATLPSRELSIEAHVSKSVGSVKFSFNSSPAIESAAPYTLCKDDGTYYYDCHFQTGIYSLSATPYSRAGAKGSAGKSLSINFQIIDEQPAPPLEVTGFTLINADTNSAVPGFDPIPYGAILDLSALPPKLNIRANTYPQIVGSVHFRKNSVSTSQNEAPYALCNDSDGYYHDCDFLPGEYSIDATAYELPSLQGQSGEINEISFDVISGVTTTVSSSTVPASSSTTSVPTSTTSAPATTSIPTTTTSVPTSTTSVPTSTTSVPTSTTSVPTSTTSVPASTTSVAPPLAVSSFTLINATTNLPVPGFDPIYEGAVLVLSELPSKLNIRANTNPTIVGSVGFTNNSTPTTQNEAPYALCNDSSGYYHDCAFTAGSYTVTAMAFELPSKAGQSSEVNQLNFIVLNSSPGSTTTSTTSVASTTTVSSTTSELSTTTTVSTTTNLSTTTVVANGAFLIWTNDGGDKVTQDELRANVSPASVVNNTWDGSNISVFGAKNETVSFNMIIEAPVENINGVNVSFNKLTGPEGFEIKSVPKFGDDLLNYNDRNIEQFYVRYLKIEGLSRISYENYDERHVPERFRRPWSGNGYGSGGWSDRPDADKYYPEIAVPIELESPFNITAGKNQSIWTDIYIPKNAPSGLYTGTVTLTDSQLNSSNVSVSLEVRNFTLPDQSHAKTMVYLGYQDINRRYTGVSWPNAGSTEDQASKIIRDRHFQLAKRHRISLIDSDNGASAWSQDRPRDEWISRLDGSLFTSAAGYDGPGVNIGNDIYSIGTYGTWSWKSEGQSSMQTHTDNWENWFSTNFPNTDHFLYLVDESTNYAETEQWASWVKNNPGIGSNLKTFATLALPHALDFVPSLNIAASWFAVADDTTWAPANQAVISDPEKDFYIYNGKRPASGSFATEDDGVALRTLPWIQYKMKLSRWFFWESTYYNNFQGGTGQTNVFQNAQTFGGYSGFNASTGKYGWNYSNGDGVLFYPGVDTVFPAESYGFNGPIASLRLKHWRRGIQDVDYIEQAYAIDPSATQAIIDQIIPKALWEYGVDDPNDPTWTRTDVSWPIDPNVWENARKQLADIIEGN